MNGSKPFWASKSFWGSATMVGATVATMMKIDLGDPTLLAASISALIGAGLAFYGRIKAIKKIG